MTTSAIAGSAELPYVAFDVEVVKITALSPTFVRVTFSGPDLDRFADNGNDQRLKLVLPLADSGLRHFPREGDWYVQWRQLPTQQQNPLRTYTVRAVRQDRREVDIDLVRHGDSGPASAWAGAAVVGDRLVLIGPNARCAESTTAAEWRPSVAARQLLNGADETAVPAALNILAALPADAQGVAVLEVPTDADFLPVEAPSGFRVMWRARRGSDGSALEAAVREVVGELVAVAAAPGEDPGLSTGDVLWDVPAEDCSSPLYAWLAGEAGSVARLRRYLVRDLAVDRRAVAFMGYWRYGRAEG